MTIEKKILSLVLALAMAISLVFIPSVNAFALPAENPSGFWTDYADTEWEGDGTESSPYLISSAEELAGIAKLVNEIPSPGGSAVSTWDTAISKNWYNHVNHFSGKYFVLTADIDLSAHYWVPIGNDFMGKYGRAYRAFEGNFDGNNHTISGLVIDTDADTEGNYYKKAFGLFGVVGGTGIASSGTDASDSSLTYASTSAIKNIRLSDGRIRMVSSIDEGRMVGALAGYVNSVCVSNVTSDIDIYYENSNSEEACCKAGGLMCDLIDCSLINCNCSGNVTVKTTNSGDRTIYGGLYADLLASKIDCIINGCSYSGSIDVDSYSDSPVMLGGVFGRSRICEDSITVSFAPKIAIKNCVNTGLVKLKQKPYEDGVWDKTNVGGLGGIVNVGNDGVANDVLFTVENCTNSGIVDVNQLYEATSDYTDNTEIGGIFGRAKSIHIVNCTNTTSGTITVRSAYKIDLGGVTGKMMNNTCRTQDSTLINCENHAEISVKNCHYVFAGGITGRLQSETMLNCVNTGNVDIEGVYRVVAGGLAGQIGTGGQNSGPVARFAMILNSYNHGNVSLVTTTSALDSEGDKCEKAVVGGIAGLGCNDRTNAAHAIYLIENSYNAGALSLDSTNITSGMGIALGGIIGGLQSDVIGESDENWTVHIDEAEIPELYTGETGQETVGYNLVIRNCAWLNTCGAAEDVNYPTQAAVFCSKSAIELGGADWLNSMNSFRSSVDADGDAVLSASSLPQLATDSKQWYIGDSGYPEFIAAKESEPVEKTSYYAENSYYQIPVSGDKERVNVQVTVNGTNARVKNITEADIAKAGTNSEVVMDLSKLSSNVTGVTIPKSTFENITKSEAKGLEVKFPNGTTAMFDSDTLKAISDQAVGNDIQLVVNNDNKAESSMTEAQKKVVKDMKKAVVLDAYFTSNGKRISDFKGGEADLTVEYSATSPVRVWYVTDDGEKTIVPSDYDGKTVKFTVKHFSHYVVEMLDGSLYSECPQDDTCVYAKFTDAYTNEWYHDGVHFCVENGYMNGVSTTQFVPNGSLSRAMIVTMLWNMEGKPVTDYAMSFKDVAEDQWYTEAIRWAQSTKVVEGYNDDSFGPDQDVTREQLATILYRYAKYKGYDVSVGEDTNILSYDDAIDGISEWSMNAMQWACGAGIINGIGTKLEAHGSATRAQAASMIQRFCENVAK